MKVLIVNNMAPFIWGGAEELAVNLQKNVIAAGHQSEVLRIPFQWDPATCLPSQMLMVRSLELTNVDRVIALKFPSYLIRHPHKTLWLLHQYRQAYDLLDVGQSNLVKGDASGQIRSAVVAADHDAFTESRRIFVNSNVTRDRLKKYNGFDADVLLPPVNDPELFTGGSAEGYIFAGGRINSMKRQHLLVEALAKTASSVKLVVAGPPDGPEDARRLVDLVDRHGLHDRVKLDLRFLPRRDYAAYVNGANSVAYLPYDEDSLGYVTMEAATAGKALISTLDSGGVLGLAKQGETGWVTEPHPAALAKALTEACLDSSMATLRGNGARDRWNAMGITWPRTVERLLS